MSRLRTVSFARWEVGVRPQAWRRLIGLHEVFSGSGDGGVRMSWGWAPGMEWGKVHTGGIWTIGWYARSLLLGPVVVSWLVRPMVVGEKIYDINLDEFVTYEGPTVMGGVAGVSGVRADVDGRAVVKRLRLGTVVVPVGGYTLMTVVGTPGTFGGDLRRGSWLYRCAWAEGDRVCEGVFVRDQVAVMRW